MSDADSFNYMSVGSVMPVSQVESVGEDLIGIGLCDLAKVTS